MAKRQIEPEEPMDVARFLAPPKWLARLERECIKWGVPRSQVIRECVERLALGPEGLAALYGRTDTTSRERGNTVVGSS